MDGEILKKIFEELLDEYKDSEQSCIYEFSSDIDEELKELEEKLNRYRNRFYQAFKD
ncbi:hypothetical protein [Bacillus cereus]|uniref:hypothetical protein n=1 Tax=Bacillus cereus TaxID=1396 RepID=UPI001BA83C91|nr:hypothetical protein [Bacillus cereus]